MVNFDSQNLPRTPFDLLNDLRVIIKLKIISPVCKVISFAQRANRVPNYSEYFFFFLPHVRRGIFPCLLIIQIESSWPNATSKVQGQMSPAPIVRICNEKSIAMDFPRRTIMRFTFRENENARELSAVKITTQRCKADAVMHSVRDTTYSKSTTKENKYHRTMRASSLGSDNIIPFITAHPLCLFRFQIHRATSRRIHCHSLTTPYCLFNVQGGEKSLSAAVHR